MNAVDHNNVVIFDDNKQEPQDRRIYRAFQYTRTTRLSRDLIRWAFDNV